MADATGCTVGAAAAAEAKAAGEGHAEQLLRAGAATTGGRTKPGKTRNSGRCGGQRIDGEERAEGSTI